MSQITITNNGASRVIVALQPVPAVQNLHNLKISSQWSGVKNPDALHAIASLNPDTDDLRALHAWLGTYLEVNADTPAAPVQEQCSKCHGLGYYDEGHENDDGSMSGGNYVDCEKCKPPAAPVQEPVGRTDQQIVDQTEELAVWLLSWGFNRQSSPDLVMRESNHPIAKRCWAAACHIQEMLTATDPENSVAELDVGTSPAVQQAASQALELARLPADDTEGGAA